jgi:hypothetical protein
MQTQTAKLTHTEQERRRYIEEMIADHGPDWAEPYQPGSFGCHELLDRTALLAELVERSLLSHPACVQDPDWFALAERAGAALQELYQRVGEKHLAGTEPRARQP